MIFCRNSVLQARNLHGLGLQIPSGLGHEVPVPGLGGDVGLRCRKLLRVIARSKEMQLYAGSISWNRVHMLISISRQLEVSRALQYLKGKSSHPRFVGVSGPEEAYWGQHLWARGYLVASSGNVTDEVWKEYTKNQLPPKPDDDVEVV